jgi:hypothetical protein
MPLLPLQSPARVGDAPAAAPANVISLKSQSVAEMAAAVIVRVVPIVLDSTKIRLLADAPSTVNVPLTVWFALKTRFFIFALVAETVKLLNVFVPVIIGPVGKLPVLETL